MTRNGKIQNNRKAAFPSMQSPIMVSLVSLLLLAGQPVLAGDGLPLVLQPSYQKPTSQFNQSPRDATNGQINDNFEAIQQRLSEQAGRKVSPQETGAWIEKQTGVPMTKRDLPLTGVEKSTGQLMEYDKSKFNNGKSFADEKQVFSGSKSENGSISLTTEQYQTNHVEAGKKTTIGASREIKLTQEGTETKNKSDISVSASASATAVQGEAKTRIINSTGTAYAVGAVEGAGPKAEIKGTLGNNGVGISVGASALSFTASGGGGVIKDNTFKEGTIEFGGKLGVGAELKLLPNDGWEAKGSALLGIGVKYKNGTFPESDSYDLHQDLADIHITPESYKSLSRPNKSEPSELNDILGDIEREKGGDRGNETIFEPDPGSNPKLILIDGQYVPETPIPAEGSILDPSQGSSPVASSNAAAAGNIDRRQSMKDDFNRNKQQYDQAARQRQMERDAQAAQSQSNGQMQDFMSIMNTAITAGSAARTAPSSSTTGSKSVSQPSYNSIPCQGWCCHCPK